MCCVSVDAQSNLYKEDKDELRRVGNLWALGFIGLALCALCGRLALETGFGVAGERLTRTLRNMAFNAMVRCQKWYSQTGTVVQSLLWRVPRQPRVLIDKERLISAVGASSEGAIVFRRKRAASVRYEQVHVYRR